MEVEVLILANGTMLPGRTQDINELGVALITPVELNVGTQVELQIGLPAGTRTVRAIVRHRNVYLHGFEFAQPLIGIFSNDVVAGDLNRDQGN